MKSIKRLGLTALAALMAMAFLGASSAMAETTAMCGSDQTTCSSPITHFHEKSIGDALILTSIVNVKCEVLFLGDALNSGLANPLIIHGNFSYECKEQCGVTEENGPAEVVLLKTSSDTFAGELEFLIHVQCFGIDCKYNGVGLSAIGLGALTSLNKKGLLIFDEQEMTREAGLFCPLHAFLDIESEPLSATYTSK